MTLRRIQVYGFIALIIMLFCACSKETEDIGTTEEQKVPFEISMSSKANPTTPDESALMGENAITSIRILVFKRVSSDWQCEYNEKIARTGSDDSWANKEELSCTATTGGYTFKLGEVTTGYKKILVIANEESYYSEGGFPYTATGASYDYVIAAHNGKSANALPNGSATSLFMTGGINTTIPVPSSDALPTVNIELKRACAKIDANIWIDKEEAEGDLNGHTFKVTKVELKNGASIVPLFSGLTVAAPFNTAAALSYDKTTTTTPSGVFASIPVEEENSADATLISSLYTYENIQTEQANATYLEVTIEETGTPEPWIIGDTHSKSYQVYFDSDDYSIYRNYHYILDIKVKKGPLVTTYSSSSRSNASNNLHFEVTATRIEE